MSYQESTQAIAKIKERVQLTERERQIEERQSEGLGVAEWCERQESVRAHITTDSEKFESMYVSLQDGSQLKK